MEFIELLSRAHPTGIGSVSVHLFGAGNRNETIAGFEPWVSQVWGKWGKNQSETQNRRAVERLETGKGEKSSLCTTAIRKEGKSCYTSPISELGKQILVITVTLILSSLKKKPNKTQKTTWQHFLEGRKRKKGEEAESISTENVFLRCLCDFCQWREECLSSSQMSSSSCPCGNLGSPSTSRQCSSVFSTRQWQIFVWFYFSILVILHFLLNSSWRPNCIQLLLNRAKQHLQSCKSWQHSCSIAASTTFHKEKWHHQAGIRKEGAPCGKSTGTKEFHPTGHPWGFFWIHPTCHAPIWIPSSSLASDQLLCSLFPANSHQTSVWSSHAVAHLITAIWFSAFRNHKGSVPSYLQKSEIPTDCPWTMNPQEEKHSFSSHSVLMKTFARNI